VGRTNALQNRFSSSQQLQDFHYLIYLIWLTPAS
jgi:hypothetical protein